MSIYTSQYSFTTPLYWNKTCPREYLDSLDQALAEKESIDQYDLNYSIAPSLNNFPSPQTFTAPSYPLVSLHSREHHDDLFMNFRIELSRKSSLKEVQKHFITHRNFVFSNEEKFRILEDLYLFCERKEEACFDQMIWVVKRLNIEITLRDFVNLKAELNPPQRERFDLRLKEDANLIQDLPLHIKKNILSEMLVQGFKPTNPQDDFQYLKHLFDKRDFDPLFTRLWSRHKTQLLDEVYLAKETQKEWKEFNREGHIKFLVFLFEEGMPATWFNTPLYEGTTPLQNVASKGRFDIVQKIVAKIPKGDFIVGDEDFHSIENFIYLEHVEKQEAIELWEAHKDYLLSEPSLAEFQKHSNRITYTSSFKLLYQNGMPASYFNIPSRTGITPLEFLVSRYEFSLAKEIIEGLSEGEFIQNFASAYLEVNFALQIIVRYSQFDLLQEIIKRLPEDEIIRSFNSLYQRENTFLQTLANRGEFDLFQQILKMIPKERVLLRGEGVYQHEMEDCLLDPKPIDLSFYDPATTLVAQNGCRAVLLTQTGEAYAYPGYSAAKIAETLIGGDVDYVKAYHNAGHASVAFSDGEHFGFYSAGNPFDGADQLLEGSVSVKWQELPISPFISGKNIYDFATTFPKDTPYKILDDSDEAYNSTNQNDLVLKVYGSSSQVQKMKIYALQTKYPHPSLRKSSYHPWNNNCVNFVQNTIKASGTQADFREAFTTSQLLIRPGKANYYTLLQTQGPSFARNPVTFGVPSAARVVDHLARDTILYGGLFIAGYTARYTLRKTFQLAKKIGSCFSCCFRSKQKNIKTELSKTREN